MTRPDPIRTRRLVLRLPVEADYVHVAAFMRSPRACFVGGPVTDEFDLWRGFLGGFGHWMLRGYGMFVIECDGRPIGRVGVIDHVMWDEPELGWQLFDGFEGFGYATEAAIAARDWACAEHGLAPLISYIAADNRRSIRLAERLGARLERDGTLLGKPVQIWRHPQPAARRDGDAADHAGSPAAAGDRGA